jgi:hypothetical protein
VPAWTYNGRLSQLLIDKPNAHTLLCYILSNQQGGELVTQLRELRYVLRNHGQNETGWWEALTLLVDAGIVTKETTKQTTIITLVNPEEFGIMPLLDKDRAKPLGDTAYSLLKAEVHTVLNYYRRTVKRGDDFRFSEPVIQYWLEKGVTKERLMAAADAYNTAAEAAGNPYRRKANNFFDPENGVVADYLPDEGEAVNPAGEMKESTKQMREVFAKKEEKDPIGG